jgi:hypothetical protein
MKNFIIHYKTSARMNNTREMTIEAADEQHARMKFAYAFGDDMPITDVIEKGAGA